jgi:hypothetical protein
MVRHAERWQEMSLIDIVGYTYKADIFCPECILNEANDTGIAHDDEYAVEFELDGLAKIKGVDRYDERSFDSGDFPKVIFRGQLLTSDPKQCGQCGKELGA